MNRALHLLSLGAVVVMAAALLSRAGPLNPPSGPVASTYKTLWEVEPRTAINATNTPGSAAASFVISQPGSYYLAGNLATAVNKPVVQVTANDVTIDLCGFSLSGNAFFQDGITVAGSVRGLTVRNGTITGVSNGINASAATSGRFTDLQIAGIFSTGLAAGSDARVERVSVSSASNGIQTGDRCTIDSCSVRGVQVRGIQAGSNCTVTRCACTGCGSNNIEVAGACVVEGCTASGSTGGNGITATSSTVVSNCVANGNTFNGIDVSDRSRVRDCIARGNAQHGIHITFVGAVERCTCDLNTQSGIVSNNGGYVDIIGNMVAENGNSNGSPGILVAIAGGNRVEGNNVISNAIGIQATSTRNIIVRNVVAGNGTDFSINSGNTFGPVINAAAAGDLAAVTGASHPWANIRY